MSFGNSEWGSPIEQDVIDRFTDDVAEDTAFGEAANLEEVALQYDLDLATTDIGNANAELTLNILSEAAAAADNQFETRRTQDPLLDGANKVPGAMRILVCGVMARVAIAPLTATLTELDEATGVVTAQANISAIQQAMDESIISLKNGSVRRFRATGDEVFSYGSFRRIPTVIANSTGPVNYANGTTLGKDRGWKKLKPFELGVDQQIDFIHVINRQSNWPSAFRIRYMLATIIARVK